jgi:hypothetical protein
MRPIIANTIEHKDQRYPTVGDYFIDWLGRRRVVISEMKDDRYEQLVLIHELVEMFLVEDRKISEKSIDAFDKKFEAERKKGKRPKDAEPGNDKRAPYFKEHQFATKVEMMLAKELGVNWKKYNQYVNGL